MQTRNDPLVPAKAGTQDNKLKSRNERLLDSRVRGNERAEGASTRMRFALLGALVALALTTGTPALAQPANSALPDGAGRDLLTGACTSCHNLSTIVVMRDGAAGWKHQVENMVLRGAQLSGAEVDTLVQYLAANFGPGSQRAANTQGAPVTLPDGAGRELVEGHCGLCHDLGRVVAIKRHKADWGAIVANMVGRGAPATPDEARTILAYLTAKFASD